MCLLGKETPPVTPVAPVQAMADPVHCNRVGTSPVYERQPTSALVKSLI